jgi:hypothetical protein
MSKIFREQPKLTTADKDRLNKDGYLDGWNKLVKTLKDKKPSEDDLKRLLLMELESPAPRRPLLEKLIVQIQKRERHEVSVAIKAAYPGVTL